MASALSSAARDMTDNERPVVNQAERHHLVVVSDDDTSWVTGAPEPVQLRAEKAAEQLGLQVADIERLPFDLSALESEGVFVNVDARNFGLLDRRLDWRALGVNLSGRGDLAFRQQRCGLGPDRYRLLSIRFSEPGPAP